jgi:hypothetical protein
MKLKSNFSLNLDFKPLREWPESLPAVALGDEILGGFERDHDHPVFVHEWTSFDQSVRIFKSLHPQLTLPELARFHASPRFRRYFQTDSLLRAYGFHPAPDLERVLEFVAQRSLTFQNLVSEKKLSFQELECLLPLDRPSLELIEQDTFKIRESRQELARRFEYLSDLIQMGKSSTEIFVRSLEELRQLRFPVSTARDEALSDTELPWHSLIKSKMKRRGDKAGFEIQFYAGTPAELTKLAQNLSKVAEAWNSHS